MAELKEVTIDEIDENKEATPVKEKDTRNLFQKIGDGIESWTTKHPKITKGLKIGGGTVLLAMISGYSYNKGKKSVKQGEAIDMTINVNGLPENGDTSYEFVPEQEPSFEESPISDESFTVETEPQTFEE